MDNNRQLSLYLHIPFCSLKCSYCDFNSYAGIEDQVGPYVDALIKEISCWGSQAGGFSVETLFFGGGTPSLLPLADMKRIIMAIRTNFVLMTECEISLEANPGTVDDEYLRGIIDLGVNRLSLGVQSFDSNELVALDRTHTTEEVYQAFHWAREAGFQRLNLDLIYGLPGQTLSSWRSNLEAAIDIGPDHLSLYALTVEDGTKLAYDVGTGKSPAPDPDLQADMYEWSQGRLAETSYDQYEISNWSHPGQSCQHNLVYWENRSYLGLGCGAHSSFEGYRFSNVYSPRQYIEHLTEVTPIEQEAVSSIEALLGGMPQITWTEKQSQWLAISDTLILGLRLLSGVSMDSLRSRFGDENMSRYESRLDELQSLGLLEERNGRLCLSQRGLLLGNEVFVRLLPE